MADPKLSVRGAAVLRAFLDVAPEELTGSELMNSVGISSGTLYPLLSRFESAKWLTSRWEAGDPAKMGRPRRRYYRLTALGANKARECIELIVPGIWSRA
ncbi:PadR family transcriptional regulator [Steroidobacter flavus]|uniref:PadR family transcriptional regulator n=1 Tax=Steroidobacter flavus TaxID=1842136 RepID=A0ABV8SY62_9GAMM